MKTKSAIKSEKYNKKLADIGLCKLTVRVPIQCKDEAKELMAIITEFYLEKGEFHKDLFPSMYRDFNTGVMGNKSLYDVKKLASKNEKKA